MKKLQSKLHKLVSIVQFSLYIFGLLTHRVLSLQYFFSRLSVWCSVAGVVSGLQAAAQTLLLPNHT